MPKFIAISYGDQAGYDRTPPDVRDAARAEDAKLQKNGAVMGMAGEPVQVRNPDALKVSVTKGPFLQSPMPVAGFHMIEAADLNAAIDMISKGPGAVMHGVVEVWPLKTSKSD